MDKEAWNCDSVAHIKEATGTCLHVTVQMSVMSHALTGDVLLFCYDCRMTELSYLSIASLTLSCEVTDNN